MVEGNNLMVGYLIIAVVFYIVFYLIAIALGFDGENAALIALAGTCLAFIIIRQEKVQ
jgi:positive regulator of sigma E activity